jgi:hypothetical protein
MHPLLVLIPSPSLVGVVVEQEVLHLPTVEVAEAVVAVHVV